MTELTPAQYAEVREALVKDTELAMERTRSKMTSSEEDFFICVRCLRITHVRHVSKWICPDCVIHGMVKGFCKKCGSLIITSNDGNTCLNKAKCIANSKANGKEIIQ